MTQTRNPRLLVIGLAETTLDLLVPWGDAGRLPNLTRLMQYGAWGRLRSQIPAITPQLWATIVTGRSPGHHGAYDFWQRGPDGQFREINGNDLHAAPIWSRLSERGLPSAIVNVPFTYPPHNINGFMISGEDAPGAHPSIASPESIYHEITGKFGRYRLKDIFPGGRNKRDYLTLIEEDVRKQTDVTEYLLARKPWDFAMVCYSAAAIAQHYFWGDMTSGDTSNPYRHVIRSAYEALDGAIGRLVAAAGPQTCVFVISDCGAGPLRSGVQVNTFLKQEGFLVRHERRSTDVSRGVVARLRTGVQGALQKRLPKSWYYGINHRLAGAKTWVQSYLSGSDIDWSRTRAFSRGKEGDLFINMRGRDPHGIVAPGDEYESVCSAIIERLEALVDPTTGEKAVDRVYRATELYQGPMVDWAPDLVIAWRDNAYMPTESDRDKESIFVPRWREYMNWPTTGSHRLDGVLLAHGPGIRRGTVTGARIIDLVPTWLRCLGEDIPADLEGELIADVFAPSGEALQSADAI